MAITTDELAHIASGYYYLETSRYFVNTEHPPLIKDISAIPSLFLKPIFPVITNENLADGYAWNNYPIAEYVYSRNLEKINDPWDLGRVFLFNPKNDPDIILFWSRFFIALFNAIFLFLLHLLLSKNWGQKTSLFSLFLIVFSQFTLAHGSLVTMDFMSSILQIITLVAFSLYLTKQTTHSFLITSLFLSLALLAKFSSVIILPAMFLGGVLYISIVKKSLKEILKYILKYLALSSIALAIITIYYTFHVLNMNSDEVIYQFQRYLPQNVATIMGSNIFRYFLNNPITRGLMEYVAGIFMVFGRMSGASQQIFFMGNIYGSEGAGAWYFPILYLTKLSIGFLFLTFAGIIAFLKNFFASDLKENLLERFKKFVSNPLALTLLIVIYLYTVLTLSSNLQIGLRHIFPIVVAVALLTAKFISNRWGSIFIYNIKFKHIFIAIFIFIIYSTLSAFPFYLSYYNYFGGGTDKGYRIATDSNYDWGGQDIKRLAGWINDNNIPNIYADIPSSYPTEYYLGNAYIKYDSLRQDLPTSGSIVAISVSKLQLIKDNKINLLENNLIKKIGKTIFVFQIP